MNKAENNILLDVVQRLTRIEDKMIEIEGHTKTMNRELGECRDSINTCKEDIKEVSKKFFVRLSWKQLSVIIGGTTGLVTLVYEILKVIKLW
jgi:hypothetical protein